jgi:hypothetical protein
MPQSPNLVQAEATHTVDPLTDQAQELRDSPVMAGNGSDTEEEGETPLPEQLNISDKRRQQNAKFNSWYANALQ